MRSSANTCLGTESLRSRMKPIKAPKTPNTAPEAPALSTSGRQYTLAKLPHTPDTKYSTRKPVLPTSRSTSGPRFQKTHMFRAIWIRPMCTKVDVTSRHHWPSRVCGP